MVREADIHDEGEVMNATKLSESLESADVTGMSVADDKQALSCRAAMGAREILVWNSVWRALPPAI
jgi:hypothetical protein